MATVMNWNAIRPDFSGSGRSMDAATRNVANVSTMLQQFQERNARLDEAARDDARLAIVQEREANRATLFGRSEDQRTATMGLAKIQNSENQPLIDAARAYAIGTADLPTLPGMPTGSQPLNFSTENEALNTAMTRDPIATREALTKNLQDSGLFTSTEMSARVEADMARRYPTSTEEGRKMTQESLDLALKERLKALGGGGNVTVGENGQLQISGGISKTVTTRKYDAAAMNKFNREVLNVPTNSTILGNLGITSKSGKETYNMNEIVELQHAMSLSGVSQDQIEQAMIGKSNDGTRSFIIPNAGFQLPDGLGTQEVFDNFVAEAKKYGIDNRQTTKGGTGANGSIDALLRQYQIDSRKNRNSASRGRATAADFPEFFKAKVGQPPPKEKPKKKEKPVFTNVDVDTIEKVPKEKDETSGSVARIDELKKALAAANAKLDDTSLTSEEVDAAVEKKKSVVLKSMLQNYMNPPEGDTTKWYNQNFNLGKDGVKVVRSASKAVKEAFSKINIIQMYKDFDKVQGELGRAGESFISDLFKSNSTRIKERNAKVNSSKLGTPTVKLSDKNALKLNNVISKDDANVTDVQSDYGLTDGNTSNTAQKLTFPDGDPLPDGIIRIGNKYYEVG